MLFNCLWIYNSFCAWCTLQSTLRSKHTHTLMCACRKRVPNRPAGGPCAACKAKSGTGPPLHLIHFRARPSPCHMDQDDQGSPSLWWGCHGVGASAITFKSVRIVIDLRDFLQPEYWLILGRTTRHHDTRFLLAQGINQMHKFNEFPKRLLKLIYLACEAAGLQKIEYTIRDGGSIALCTAYTVIICNQNIASTSVFS